MNPDLPTLNSMHPQLNIDQPSEIGMHVGLPEAPSMSNYGGAMEQQSINPNSYADNMAYVDSLNKEDKYMNRAKQMFDDDGSGNTGIEIIRLNKKFDIFMKRFMRAEEDIKEVKQNFYRVMHCAFAKYEQGFKRKNEYLERRRIKRKEEIERGVA